MPTVSDIVTARDRLSKYLLPTPLEASPALGSHIYLKLENVNRTHSFKIRGALNAVLSLGERDKLKGIVTASSGNHAQGVAYASSITKTKARILMPRHTPRRKVEGVRRWGAEAVLFGATYDEAEAEALRIHHDEGVAFISAYNHPHVIEGTGTIGLEILDALPEVERVIVPVSGGGLIAGIATLMKLRKPEVEVIGVNALSAPAMYNYFYATELPQVWETLAEALSGAIEKDSMTLELTKKYVDRIVLVDEEQISSAIRWMADVQGWMIEGGGAVGIAAVLSGVIPADDKPTAIIVSGGNIDGTTFRKVLYGLV